MTGAKKGQWSMMVTLTLGMFIPVFTFYTFFSQDHLMQSGKVEILVTACGHYPPNCFPEGQKEIILMPWPLSQRDDQPTTQLHDVPGM